MAVVLLGLTLVLFLIQKYYLEKRTVATLTGKANRERMLIADKSVTRPLTILCSLVSAFVVIMYISVPFGALFKLWGRNYSLSLVHFEYIMKYGGARAFRDSFMLSIIAAPITALLSMIISYLVVKKKFRSKAFIEFVSMLAMGLSQTEIKKAVDCGYWTLYRYNPMLADEGKNPLTLDSKEPAGGYQDFLKGEIRYASLAKQFPDVAQNLFQANEAEAMAKYAKYKNLAE